MPLGKDFTVTDPQRDTSEPQYSLPASDKRHHVEEGGHTHYLGGASAPCQTKVNRGEVPAAGAHAPDVAPASASAPPCEAAARRLYGRRGTTQHGICHCKRDATDSDGSPVRRGNISS